MVRSEADAELSHHAARGVFAVDGYGEAEMFFEDLSLLRHGRRSGRMARHHLAGLAEDPWVADAAAGDGDAGDAGVPDHAEDVGDFPDVAGSEDGAIGETSDEIGEHRPARGSHVFLFDGSRVNGRPGVSEFVRSIKETVEMAFRFRRLVKCAAELHGAGDIPWHGFAYGLQDRDAAFGLAEEVSAAAFVFDFFDGTGEVHVDRGERWDFRSDR